MFSFFLKGGPLMWPILLCSVISAAIILERLYALFPARRPAANIAARVKLLLQEGRFADALKLCESTPGPVPRLMAIGIHIRNRTLEEKEKMLARAGSKILRAYDRNLRVLAVIGAIAPLLGLLGTVTGMISAFMKIQELGGRVDATVLAGGIWEALITTAAGLSVAVPTLVAYYYFEGVVDDIAAALKDAATEILDLQHYPEEAPREGVRRGD